MAECIATGKTTDAEQRYKLKTTGCLGVKKLEDHGKLPFDHPAINKLSEPIHYIKNSKNELYNIVKVGKSKSETCKADAMRLSRNLAYMIAQHTLCILEMKTVPYKSSKLLQRQVLNITGITTNGHIGLWCQVKSWMEEEKIQEQLQKHN
jgi:hypothetical protein